MTHSAEEEIEYDKIRQSKIEKYGIEFLRFTNKGIYCNLDFVLEIINRKIYKKVQQNNTIILPETL